MLENKQKEKKKKKKFETGFEPRFSDFSSGTPDLCATAALAKLAKYGVKYRHTLVARDLTDDVAGFQSPVFCCGTSNFCVDFNLEC